MNTNKELDQIVSTWLDDRVVDPPHASLASAMAKVATTPQQRRRWLGRWFGRDADATRSTGVGGDTKDTDTGRTRLMFGITGVTAGAATLALIAALVVPRGDPGQPVVPAAGGGATHVVAADGSGDFTTIGEAVAAAAEGDTVLVKPGQYAEALVIDKGITIQGDGPREEVIVSFPTGMGTNEEDPDGSPFYRTLKVVDADATISGLTVAGAVPESGEFAVNILVVGGAPLLEDLDILNSTNIDAALPIIFAAHSTPVIRGSAWSGYLYTDESSGPTIEANTISGVNAIIWLNGPAEVVVRGNTFQDGASISASGGVTGVIEGNDFTEGFIGIDTGSDMLVEANTMTGLSGSLGAAIYVRDSGSKAHVVKNEVTDAATAISVIGGAEAIVEDNELVDDAIGIAWSSTAPGTIEGNAISGGVTGIVIGGGSPSVVGNSVEGASQRGVAIGSTASPSLSGNTVCGSATNVWLADNADPLVGENDICPDEPAG